MVRSDAGLCIGCDPGSCVWMNVAALTLPPISHNAARFATQYLFPFLSVPTVVAFPSHISLWVYRP